MQDLLSDSSFKIAKAAITVPPKTTKGKRNKIELKVSICRARQYGKSKNRTKLEKLEKLGKFDKLDKLEELEKLEKLEKLEMLEKLKKLNKLDKLEKLE